MTQRTMPKTLKLLFPTLLAWALLTACDSTSSPSSLDGGGAPSSTGGSAPSMTGTGGRGGSGGAPAGSGGGGAAATSGTGGQSTAAAGGHAGTAVEPGDGPDAGNGNSDGGALLASDPVVVPVSSTGPDRLYGTTYDDAGNLYAVGQIADSTDTTADLAVLVAKFTPQGTLDRTFGTDGIVRRNVVVGTNGELFRGIAVQSTGKIVVSGSVEHPGSADSRDRDIAVLRFNADGSNDTTFGQDGIVTLDLSTGVVNGTAFAADSAWGLVRYDDDRLVVSGGRVRTGGTDTDFVLVRLNADGTRDDSFGDHGVFALDTQMGGASNNASPRNVTLLPGTEGLIGAGYQPIPGADTGPVLYKVTNAGQLDTTFGTNGVFSERPFTEQTESYMAAVQPMAAGGYKLVTTGYGRELDTETTDLVSLRVTSDGKLDTTYGTNGVVRVDIGGFGDNSRRLAVLPDRRVLLVGGGRLTSANVDGVIAVLTPDGQPDATFAPKGWKTFDLGGPADFFWSVALSPNHRTAGIVGIKGVGASPTPATANDDAAVFFFSLPR